MDVQAGIVNFNSGSYLGRCVQSLLETPVVRGVYVIDNASTDHGLDDIDGGEVPNGRIQVVRNDKNYGFARGVNQFLTLASADYLLILNPDCVVAAGTLEAVSDVLDRDSSVGMAGCLLQNPDGSEQRGGRRKIPDPWNSLKRVFMGRARASRGFDLVGSALPDQPVEVEAISGAFMLVRRAALKVVGLMDEGYFLHCEDLDWCMRFRQAGWKIVFVPGSAVTHYQGASSRAHPVFVLWHKHRSMWRFYRKFYWDEYPVLFSFAVWCAIWGRFLLLLLPVTLSRMHRNWS